MRFPAGAGCCSPGTFALFLGFFLMARGVQMAVYGVSLPQATIVAHTHEEVRALGRSCALRKQCPLGEELAALRPRQ